MTAVTGKKEPVLSKTRAIASAEKVGRHRRILFEDLVKRKESSKEKGRKIRGQLTEEAQDLGLGY